MFGPSYLRYTCSLLTGCLITWFPAISTLILSYCVLANKRIYLNKFILIFLHDPSVAHCGNPGIYYRSADVAVAWDPGQTFNNHLGGSRSSGKQKKGWVGDEPMWKQGLSWYTAADRHAERSFRKTEWKEDRQRRWWLQDGNSNAVDLLDCGEKNYRRTSFHKNLCNDAFEEILYCNLPFRYYRNTSAWIQISTMKPSVTYTVCAWSITPVSMETWRMLKGHFCLCKVQYCFCSCGHYHC